MSGMRSESEKKKRLGRKARHTGREARGGAWQGHRILNKQVEVVGLRGISVAKKQRERAERSREQQDW